MISLKKVVDPNRSEFDILMEEGKKILSKNPMEALRYFKRSLAEAPDSNSVINALRMIGISNCSMGYFVESKENLDLAKEILFKSGSLKTHIAALLDRDFGNLYLTIGCLTQAHNSFLESYNLFSELGDKHEADTSWGFVGRAKFLRCDPEGKYSIARAHRRLKGSKYELDNLIWLLRSSVRPRFRHTVRALALAIKPNQVRYAISKILVIFFGGNRLYRRFFKN